MREAAASAQVISLGDDDSRQVQLPFAFPFFGATQQQIFINSDGNLTFTGGDSSTDGRTLGKMVVGLPRISPLYGDLDPLSAIGGVRVASSANRFVVSWVMVPEFTTFGRGAQQTFQVRLYPDGKIEFAYNGINAQTAVVGITPGGLLGSSAVVAFLSGSSAEYSSTIAERFIGIEEVDIVTVAQKFYENHEDAYDYLVIYNNLDVSAGGSAVAFEVTVRNRSSGTGEAPSDDAPEFGSPARLQAMMNMGHLSQYPTDPRGIVLARQQARDTPLTILAHEAGHLFLAYASIRDPNDPLLRPMLGFQNAHWYFGFNSDASLLEGNRIQDNGGNSFTTVGTVEKFSALDQYLMGWRAPEEVESEQQMFLVTGLPASFSRRIPQSGVSLSGTRRDIRLQEIIQAEGRRTPDHSVAQRRFRFAFILIVRQGTEPTPEQLAQVDTYRTEFERFFNEASSARAFADTALRRSLTLSTFPAAGVLEGRTASATVTLQTAPAGTLTISLQSTKRQRQRPAFSRNSRGAAERDLHHQCGARWCGRDYGDCRRRAVCISPRANPGFGAFGCATVCRSPETVRSLLPDSRCPIRWWFRSATSTGLPIRALVSRQPLRRAAP